MIREFVTENDADSPDPIRITVTIEKNGEYCVKYEAVPPNTEVKR